MQNTEQEIKRPRGKPPGTRQKKELYTSIFELLNENKKQNGYGYTAFAISKYIKEPYPTVQQYLNDLLAQNKIESRKVVTMTLFSIK